MTEELKKSIEEAAEAVAGKKTASAGDEIKAELLVVEAKDEEEEMNGVGGRPCESQSIRSSSPQSAGAGAEGGIT